MLSNAARIVLTDIKRLEMELKDYLKQLQIGALGLGPGLGPCLVP